MTNERQFVLKDDETVRTALRRVSPPPCTRHAVVVTVWPKRRFVVETLDGARMAMRLIGSGTVFPRQPVMMPGKVARDPVGLVDVISGEKFEAQLVSAL